MTNNPDSRRSLPDRVPFDPDIHKLESIKYILLDQWLAENLVEVPFARLPLKTAYIFYSHYCTLKCYPRVPIQAFNRALTDMLLLQWPSVQRRRTAQGTLYVNITLRGWAQDTALPHEGGGRPPVELTLCTVFPPTL